MKKILLITLIVLLNIIITSLAKEKTSYTNIPSSKVIYEDGYLKNIGDMPALRCEVIEPFYQYIGNINPFQKLNVSNIRTKFTVSYFVQEWLGEYIQIKESFLPEFKYKAFISPEVKVNCRLKKNILEIELISDKNLKKPAIEIPYEIPVKISESKTRYITSQVLVLGQNVIYSQKAKFKIIPLSETEYSKVPIQINYQYEGMDYQKLIFYSFKKGVKK